MATGDDLSGYEQGLAAAPTQERATSATPDAAFNPYLGNWHQNDDMLKKGVWIKHPKTGVIHLVMHKYQVNRLLMEGGKVVEPPLPAQEKHETPA